MKALMLSLALAGAALSAVPAPASARPLVVIAPRGWVGPHYYWRGRHYHHRVPYWGPRHRRLYRYY